MEGKYIRDPVHTPDAASPSNGEELEPATLHPSRGWGISAFYKVVEIMSTIRTAKNRTGTSDRDGVGVRERAVPCGLS